MPSDELLVFVVKCRCGHSEMIREAERGQSHAGTAADRAAQHDSVCSVRSKKGAKITPEFVEVPA